MALFKQYTIISPGEDIQCEEKSLAGTITSLPPKGVLIKMHTSGVCHSDLHQWLKGGFRLSESQYIRFADRKGMGYPKVPGHEISGTVYEFGSDVREEEVSLRKGDLVVVYPWIGCAYCSNCENGENDHCTGENLQEIGFNIDGGYSEFVTVPHYRYALPIPSTISPDLAAILGCSSLTAYNAVKTGLAESQHIGNLESTDQLHVAVVGLGGLGSWAVSFIPILFQSTTKASVIVTGIDINGSKLCTFLDEGQIQKSFHLSPTQPAQEQASKCVKETSTTSYQIIFDFVNNPLTFDLSVHLLGNHGVLLSVGLFGGTGHVQLPLLTLRRKRIIGIHVGSYNLFKEMLEFLTLHIKDMKTPPLLTYSLDDCMKALKDLKEGKVSGRSILKVTYTM